MRVSRPFLRLPVRFCADTLAREVAALPPEAWTPHPQGFQGNDAVVLVSPGGTVNDDMAGQMAPTDYLRACPYMMALMSHLGGVWGRSRLMGLAPGAEVPVHVDVHYYWRTHLRLHIPIVTNPGVRFTCGEETVHMAPGECWAFDSFRRHRVENSGSEKRVHLVLDTVGSEALWDWLSRSEAGEQPPPQPFRSPPSTAPDLAFERLNVPVVMSPWEMQCHLEYLAGHAAPHPLLDPAMQRLRRFLAGWYAAWSEFGTASAGLPTYRALIEEVRTDLHAMGATDIKLDNEELFFVGVEALMFWNAIARDPARASADEHPQPPAEPLVASTDGPAAESVRDRIDRPIFIMSSPRSGSTLLFNTLAEAKGLFSVGGESHHLIESIRGLSVPGKGWSSNRLTAQDAYPETVGPLAERFYGALRDRDGRPADGAVRMLEKTPKNALRVPFFDAVWPDSEFVFLYRDPRQTLSSMIEAWLSGGFRTYPTLPGWSGPPWSLLLVPGWEQLVGKPLPEIVAHQWATTLELLVSDLGRIPKERVRAVDYDELVATPQPVIERLARSLGVEWDRELGDELPISVTTVSRPARDKWKQLEDVIQSVWPIVEQADAKARRFLDAVRV